MIVSAILLALASGQDLEELARQRDISWTGDPATGRHVIQGARLRIVISPDLPVALVDGVPVRLSEPPAVEDGRLRLPAEIVRLISERSPLRREPPMTHPRPPVPANPAPTPPKPQRPLAGFRVALDPGHGGVHDETRARNGLFEKEVNLHVSLELQRILESWGAQVVMTRMNDSHLARTLNEDLDARVDIVNGAQPDLFLSIHANWAADPGARGFEVFVPKNAAGARDQASREIASLVRSELRAVWSTEDRGTKDEKNLRVLNGTRCPAVLVELEFLSNPSAARQLASPDVQKRLAGAIAEAARRWLLRRAR